MTIDQSFFWSYSQINIFNTFGIFQPSSWIHLMISISSPFFASSKYPPLRTFWSEPTYGPHHFSQISLACFVPYSFYLTLTSTINKDVLNYVLAWSDLFFHLGRTIPSSVLRLNSEHSTCYWRPYRLHVCLCCLSFG
jgi:hypothetical protein